MQRKLIISGGGRLQNNLHISSDKSITHRAIILSAISNHTVVISNWLQSLDCQATLNAVRAMGIHAAVVNDNELQIIGMGLHGLSQPRQALDLANSGTGLRLLAGILAAQKFDTVITGDKSLCRRPMYRIIEPLRLMGAKITAEQDNFAPLTIHGGQQLQSINYTLPIASAQVKSAILLADLYAQNKSIITEKSVSRDHTELMLDYFGQAGLDGRYVIPLNIPGDISSAAFFIVGACIAKGSDLLLQNVGLNPTRTGIIEILRLMGADIRINNLQTHNNELSGDIRVKHSKLTAITVPVHLVSNAIDEFPILAIAAACASGVTIIRGAQELRHKESDRIMAIAQGLNNIGIANQVVADGLDITGGVITGGTVDSHGDHRIAMAFAMAGLVAAQPIIVQDTQNIATSFPDFVPIACRAGLVITEINEE